MPNSGTYGEILRIRRLTEDPELRRPEFEAAIMAGDGPHWEGFTHRGRVGQPAWDNTDYGRDCVWLGQPRDYQMQIGTLEDRKRIARAVGVICCDCIWVEDRLMVWNPACEAHGGRCGVHGCTHRHLRLDGF